MHSSRRVVASGVAVLLIAFLAFVPQPARASTSRPSWAAGDFWTYGYSATVLNTSYAGSLNLNVVGTDSIVLNGTTYSTYHVKGSVTYDFGGASITYRADLWYDVNTLAIAQISVFVNVTGGITITIWGNPPQSIHWPLTAGDSWTSATNITEKETFTANGTSVNNYARLSTDFSVLADTTVTLPIGTFTTTPLKETQTGSTSYVENYWSAQVGNYVRSESYNSSGGGPQGGYNLTAYNYQGGNFFTSVVLGLPVWIWLIVLIVVIAVIVGIFVMRRGRRPMPPMAPPPMPPQMPPSEPPMGP